MKILVCGDRITDTYYHCRVSGICPEAPCPKMVIERTYSSPGGAALIAANLKSLGGHEICEAYGSCSVKSRYYAGHTLVCRIDADSNTVVKPGAYMQELGVLIDQADVIVVGDYGKGAITKELAYDLTHFVKKPIFVDSKQNPDWWKGAFAAFPNEHEKQPRATHVIRKLGDRGCEVDGELIATEPQQVYDVTGAGDVFMAAFVWDYLKSNDLKHAAGVANRAGGISVQHLGTWVVRPEELTDGN